MDRVLKPRRGFLTYAKALVLAVGGGIGMYLAFPPTGAWFLMPLALGALYWCTREHGATVAGLSGLAWSLAFSCLTLSGFLNR